VRIAIDARALLGQRTGIGTYTSAVARELAARGEGEVGLFLPRPLTKTRTGSALRRSRPIRIPSARSGSRPRFRDAWRSGARTFFSPP
jgi:hypothetical protein